MHAGVDLIEHAAIYIYIYGLMHVRAACMRGPGVPCIHI